MIFSLITLESLEGYNLALSFGNRESDEWKNKDIGNKRKKNVRNHGEWGLNYHEHGARLGVWVLIILAMSHVCSIFLI